MRQIDSRGIGVVAWIFIILAVIGGIGLCMILFGGAWFLSRTQQSIARDAANVLMMTRLNGVTVQERDEMTKKLAALRNEKAFPWDAPGTQRRVIISQFLLRACQDGVLTRDEYVAWEKAFASRDTNVLFSPMPPSTPPGQRHPVLDSEEKLYESVEDLLVRKDYPGVVRLVEANPAYKETRDVKTAGAIGRAYYRMNRKSDAAYWLARAALLRHESADPAMRATAAQAIAQAREVDPKHPYVKEVAVLIAKDR